MIINASPTTNVWTTPQYKHSITKNNIYKQNVSMAEYEERSSYCSPQRVPKVKITEASGHILQDKGIKLSKVS